MELKNCFLLVYINTCVYINVIYPSDGKTEFFKQPAVFRVAWKCSNHTFQIKFKHLQNGTCMKSKKIHECIFNESWVCFSLSVFLKTKWYSTQSSWFQNSERSTQHDRGEHWVSETALDKLSHAFGALPECPSSLQKNIIASVLHCPNEPVLPSATQGIY